MISYLTTTSPSSSLSMVSKPKEKSLTSSDSLKKRGVVTDIKATDNSGNLGITSFMWWVIPLEVNSVILWPVKEAHCVE